MTKREELENEFPPNPSSARSAPIRSRTKKRTQEIEVEESEKKVKMRPIARALRQKPTLSQRFVETFLGDDARSTAQYVIWDILVPAAKNTIQEMITTSLEMVLFGEARHRSRDRDKGRTVVSYNKYYDREERSERTRHRTRGIDFDLDSIVFRTAKQASDVLDALTEYLERYDQVTVGDFFDLADIDSDWAARRWGWDDLKEAYCTHTRGGYVIVFPQPIDLNA